MKIKLMLIVLLFPCFIFSQGFTTSNGNLIDNNGNNFIMKGLNVPLAWYVGNVTNSINDLRINTGANCLRIVVETSTNENSWQNAVLECIANDMIPMVELHDATGSTNTSDVQAMANFWIQHADFLTQTGVVEYILINICNEWGTWAVANSNGSQWRDAFNTAVTSIRNAGINTTLVIDAVGYGQDIDDAKNIRNYAAGMITNDPQHNLLFSVHMYCEWAKGGDDIPGTLQWARDNQIPFIVGEFGYQHATDGSCDIDEQLIMDQCQAKGIGWLAWSQKGNSGGVEYLDLCNDWECTSLSTWGNTVINGTNGTKTAITCSVFESNPNEPPTVSLTAPSDGYSVIEPADITITATASDSDGSVASVAFYNGTTLISTDESSPYSITWTNVTQGIYILTAVATDDKGAVTSSQEVSITVNQNPCPVPTLGEDQSICPGNSIILDANVAASGVTYSWQKDGSPISGTGSTLSINQPGTYSVTASKTGCSTENDEILILSAALDVVSDEICKAGTATLSVSGGSGGPYKWYDSETTGSLLFTGTDYSPSISTTTVYYIEDAGAGDNYTLGNSIQNSSSAIWNITGADIAATDYNDKHLLLTVEQDITIQAVAVYSGSTGNNIVIRVLEDDETTIVNSKSFSNIGTGKQRLELDFSLTPGTYRFDAVGTSGTLEYESENGQFPFGEPGIISVTGAQDWVITEQRNGYFYDFEISTGAGGSICGRTPVTATINPNGTQCVSETVSLTTGWNLIGCPLSGTTDVETALSSIWNYVEVIKNSDTFYKSDQPDFLNTLHTVKYGYGYLIKVSDACELSW